MMNVKIEPAVHQQEIAETLSSPHRRMRTDALRLILNGSDGEPHVQRLLELAYQPSDPDMYEYESSRLEMAEAFFCLEHISLSAIADITVERLKSASTDELRIQILTEFDEHFRIGCKEEIVPEVGEVFRKLLRSYCRESADQDLKSKCRNLLIKLLFADGER